ncbi:cobyrinate a,c-diamide synthase [Acaryochloris sp. IP29b_bin.148]|uniref:cobyrinate a,c-diamide synthase n=1 Tax=Acaryochloris sp. IP29b_bin.148 TaxID=2969218 RepID=UPI0026215F9C|nr:cobyrinate a,c-diamide synthase [Acaryochloris sp. IP29b_bin.148]
MAIVIAGDRSGVGKTTVTAAILASLKSRQVTVQSFKVGPDYIDPMLHSVVTQRPCRNLDPILTSEIYIQTLFTTHTQTADYALVEGVMGLFDGAVGQGGRGSTAHIARQLNLPLLLVLDCSRLSDSVAALVHGYRSFDPHLRLAGVVLNRVGSDRHLTSLEAALQPLDIKILGVLRRQTSLNLPTRHLGLVPVEELEAVEPLLQELTEVGHTCFDWSALLPLLATSPGSKSPVPVTPSDTFSQPSGSTGIRSFQIHSPHSANNITHPQSPEPVTRIRLAIARDAAFNFYYADNLDLLEHLGAELVYWSPLQDKTLPPGTQGLYLGGGFPEMYASTLAANTSTRHAVKTAIEQGLPTYAECGGLMYLCESLQDLSGQTFPMVGILPTTVKMATRLTLGYRRAISTQNTPLLTVDTQVWGHEFHHSQLHQSSQTPIYTFSGETLSQPQSEGWSVYNLHASYLHLHWGHRPELPHRFLQQCQALR